MFIYSRTFANIITTSQVVGNCFTLFHRSYKKLASMATVSSGFSQTPVIKGSGNDSVSPELSERPFRPNEVLRIRVNFSAMEHTSLNEPVFGQIVVHDSSMAPTVRLKALEIQPGYFYDFFLTKSSSDLLPAPYVTDCLG